MTHIVQFEVESTRVTHRLSTGVASPQCCDAGVAVGTQCTCSLTHNLRRRKEIIRVFLNLFGKECCVLVKVCQCGSYQSLLGSDQRSVQAVYLVVQSTGVTQVVARTIPTPQRGRRGSTVHTLSGLCSRSKVHNHYRTLYYNRLIKKY